MKGLNEDVLHALRVYRATPLSSVIAVVALAIAIACMTASFSLLSDLVLKPHAGFGRSSQLVTIGQTNGTRFDPLPLKLMERIADEAASLEAIVGVHDRTLTWDRDTTRVPIKTEFVTRGFCPDLEPRLRLGRCFVDQDHQGGAAPSVIVSFKFWQDRLNGRPDVLGQIVKLSGGPEAVRFGANGRLAAPEEHSAEYRVVGVFASELHGTFGSETELWVPYEQAGPIFVGDGQLYRTSEELSIIARLRPGARDTSANSELSAKYREGDTELGLSPGSRLRVLSGVVADIGVQQRVRQQVRLLISGCTLLVIVAASNISLFLFSQAPRRQRELGIRMALGAPKRRLARQLATEAGLIVVLAALIGLIISFWLTGIMQNIPLLSGAQWHSASPFDWRVLIMILCATMLLTILVSLAPMIGLTRLGIAAISRRVSARAGFTQLMAETAQIAVASILAGVAVAFVWYLIGLARAERGFDGANAYVLNLEPPEPAKIFSVKPEEIMTMREHRRSIIAGLPGISAVTFGSSVPGQVIPYTARVQSASGELVTITMVSADPSYTDMLRMRLVHGRNLNQGDLGTAALVNETLAKRIWGKTNVVDEMLNPPRAQLKVVGVLKDAAFRHPSEVNLPMAFVVFAPISFKDSIIVRSSASLDEIRRLIRAKIDQGALDMKMESIRRLNDIWGAMLASDRSRTLLTTASAVLVVLLAAFGFYGTQRYLVNAGRREYAIRSAIGAGPRAIHRLVIVRALIMALPGLLIGGLLTYIVITWLRDDFVSKDVSPAAIMVVVWLGMTILILAATFGPARLAASTNPALLLKEE
jgi:ABC-type antimicrobial peptide transport system permease subunit